jgi:hypothetical protein
MVPGESCAREATGVDQSINMMMALLKARAQSEIMLHSGDKNWISLQESDVS